MVVTVCVLWVSAVPRRSAADVHPPITMWLPLSALRWQITRFIHWLSMVGSAYSTNNTWPFLHKHSHRRPLSFFRINYIRTLRLKFASATCVVPMACNCTSRIYYWNPPTRNGTLKFPHSRLIQKVDRKDISGKGYAYETQYDANNQKRKRKEWHGIFSSCGTYCHPLPSTIVILISRLCQWR